MIPSPTQKVYQNFLESLQSLQEAVKQSSDGQEAAFDEVQHLFKTQVMGLSEEDIEGNLATRWRSLQTELHRMFKLLATDWLFLRSSRQTATGQQRSNLFCDRLDRMMEYCHILLEGSGNLVINEGLGSEDA